jgi:hypothetical protein
VYSKNSTIATSGQSLFHPIKAPFSKDSLVMSYRNYAKKGGDKSQDKAPGAVSLGLYPGWV